MYQQLTKRACRRTVVTNWKCDCCGEVWIHLALKLQLCGLQRPTPSLIALWLTFAVLKCPRRFPYGGREGARAWTDFQCCSQEMMLSACMEKAIAKGAKWTCSHMHCTQEPIGWAGQKHSSLVICWSPPFFCYIISSTPDFLPVSLLLQHHIINSMKHWKQRRPTKLCVLSRIT